MGSQGLFAAKGTSGFRALPGWERILLVGGSAFLFWLGKRQVDGLLVGYDRLDLFAAGVAIPVLFLVIDRALRRDSIETVSLGAVWTMSLAAFFLLRLTFVSELFEAAIRANYSLQIRFALFSVVYTAIGFAISLVLYRFALRRPVRSVALLLLVYVVAASVFFFTMFLFLR